MGPAETGGLPGHLRTVRPREFPGGTFHEVMAKSALNRVPGGSPMPFRWTVNPYRGCTHACVYCFARGSHRYLDFDTGRDFDTQVVVKINVAEVLTAELARPSWTHDHVALGTNTDPYQPAEGRYRLMPGIIRALMESGTPLSILTKSTLMRRDIPLLVEASARGNVDLAMSIALADDDVRRTLEPGTPTTQARLDTVATLRDAGLECDVFLMPILPHLTDATDDLARHLRDIRDAGARAVIAGPLHLRRDVKPWFFAWLERTHPELVSRYRRIFPGHATQASQDYRRDLAARVRPLIRRLGLEPRAHRGITSRAVPVQRRAAAPAPVAPALTLF